MARIEVKWRAFEPFLRVIWSFLLASVFVSAERSLLIKHERLSSCDNVATNYNPISRFMNMIDFAESILEARRSHYHHIWPDLRLSWQIIVGTIVGFFGAAFGSVGGVGGGGIFVPMLTLIIGFDPKSATAISKCMIMGAAISTVYYNLKLRHPTLDMPIIDYDLAVLIQPMLMLGISIGVTFSVVFADWMAHQLRPFSKVLNMDERICHEKGDYVRFGLITEKPQRFLKITKVPLRFDFLPTFKAEAVRLLEANGGDEEAEYKHLPGCPCNNTEIEIVEVPQVGVLENVCWRKFWMLVFVWVAFLALQIIKNYTPTCSAVYWVVNLLQIPVSFSVSGYEAISLYKGWSRIASKGNEGTNWKVDKLVAYCFFGVVAGVVGGLLGLGGGFIMGPLFLELGVPPQVSSATSTFAMMFSSSMSVVEYYLLRRFPVPYALYFVAVATIAAFTGQHVVRKLIIITGRASIIIFILAFTIFVSAISLGGVGISNMVGKIQKQEYMGFENLCK